MTHALSGSPRRPAEHAPPAAHLPPLILVIRPRPKAPAPTAIATAERRKLFIRRWVAGPLPALHLRRHVSKYLPNLAQENLVRVGRGERGPKRQGVAHPHPPSGLLRHPPRSLELADEPLRVQRHLHEPVGGRLLDGESARERAPEHYELPAAALRHQQRARAVLQRPGLHAVHGAEDAGRRRVVRQHVVHAVRVGRQHHLTHEAVLAPVVADDLALGLLDNH
mmetsp:Transcript_38236/g.94852  ORF Transcript_38236/g.94852 Transcript_38236/m.94852 type:complete len:223 (-) Transcript_38236:389-1057(-)